MRKEADPQRGFLTTYRLVGLTYCFFPASIPRMLSKSETRRVPLCSQSVARVQPEILRNNLETHRVYRGGEWMQVMGDHLNVP
jgi:hypothetical protein